MSDRKKGTRDPIFKVAHVVRLLRGMSPADREYAMRKAGEAEPAQGSLIETQADRMGVARCKNCGVNIARHMVTGLWLHVTPEGVASTYCTGNEGTRAEP